MTAPEQTPADDGPTHTGRCACGGVQFVVSGPMRDVYNCHCHRCRRITGHHLASTAAPRDRVTLVSQHSLRWWAPDDSVGYGFCSVCGATLFWRARDSPDLLRIAAGALDPPTGLRTTRAWWVAEASDYHQRPPDLEEFPYGGEGLDPTGSASPGR